MPLAHPILEPMPDRRWVLPTDSTLMIPDRDRGGYLPINGAWVAWSPYWQRRLDEGSIGEGTPPSEQV
jgi:hypothetical protein